MCQVSAGKVQAPDYYCIRPRRAILTEGPDQKYVRASYRNNRLRIHGTKRS